MVRDTNFWSVAKVALRFGCTKQSKNLELYLINIPLVLFYNRLSHGKMFLVKCMITLHQIESYIQQLELSVIQVLQINLLKYDTFSMKEIKEQCISKSPCGIFFSLLYFNLYLFFFKYETIVRSSTSSFGHSDPDPSIVRCFF